MRINYSPKSRKLGIILCLIAFVFTKTTFAASHESKVDPSTVWDLTDLYPNDEAWNTEREGVLAELDALTSRKGTLGNGSKAFYETL